jgi:hypothetical protein
MVANHSIKCATGEEGDLLFAVKSWTFSMEVFIHHERISKVLTTTPWRADFDARRPLLQRQVSASRKMSGKPIGIPA